MDAVSSWSHRNSASAIIRPLINLFGQIQFHFGLAVKQGRNGISVLFRSQEFGAVAWAVYAWAVRNCADGADSVIFRCGDLYCARKIKRACWCRLLAALAILVLLILRRNARVLVTTAPCVKRFAARSRIADWRTVFGEKYACGLPLPTAFDWVCCRQRSGCAGGEGDCQPCQHYAAKSHGRYPFEFCPADDCRACASPSRFVTQNGVFCVCECAIYWRNCFFVTFRYGLKLRMRKPSQTRLKLSQNLHKIDIASLWNDRGWSIEAPLVTECSAVW